MIPITGASATGSIGPDGLSFSAKLSMDKCNARPIFVYVVKNEGKIWRLFDPLSPTEKLPIWKEWTEKETTYHYEPAEYRDREEQVEPPKPPSTKYRCFELCHVVTGGNFKFDKPKVADTSAGALLGSFEQPPGQPDFPITVNPIAEIQTKVSTALATPMPSGVEQSILMFGHTDMCAPFSYNHGLSQRRNTAVRTAAGAQASGRFFNRSDVSQGSVACADFNPCSGPTDHEFAAENSASGTVNNPNPGTPDGNIENRRVELFVLRDFTDPATAKIPQALREIRAELVGPGKKLSDADAAVHWPTTRGFPCKPGSTTICSLLSTEGRQRNPGGESWRFCEFLKAFKAKLECLEIEVAEQTPGTPGTTRIVREKVKDAREWTEEKTKGNYLPPYGEHYGYHMRDMTEHGVVCTPQFAPQVAVAPNNKVNADDFNLIKAGPIRVVKMDIGFWGDQRVKDLSRKAGLRRTPARYFGLIEGQFVFLCYFQTKDNAGFVKGCSEEYDEKLTPLAAKLQKACKAAGHSMLIMSKAVAEDGPDAGKLKLFFPDMHMPRKFDEKDPEYASDECIFRVQMVKSMVLHQLKRDYRLPAEQTPWLATADRLLCRNFFEDGAPKLKLPHWNTGRKFSNPFDASGSDALSTAVDAAKKAFQALMQVGFYMFEFTQDDYRRMVRKYSKEFPEKGYGRTKDVLFNWFYGFDTDKNIPPQQKTGIEEDLKSMVPGIVADVADTNFGTKLGPDTGTKPATESYDRVDGAPARDLLRFLKVVADTKKKEKLPVQVFHTGDLYELWANRRFLFEDFKDTDDPPAQVPGLIAKISPGGGDAPWKSMLKSIGGAFLQLMLGGINAGGHDLWYRRECTKQTEAERDPANDLLPPEESWNLDDVKNDFALPRFAAPSSGIGFETPGALKTPTVNYTHMPPTRFSKDATRGKGYLANEMQRRMDQVEAFEAPLRADTAGKKEDTELLGSSNVVGKNKDMGKWNAAVIQKFASLGTKFIYGNHDDYRGLPRDGANATALPFWSEPGLWVEHAHRFEDSNVDGQPFGSFLTNLAFEIQELAFGEGLLDEYLLHREQDLFQPGIMQWFLLTEFGLNSLDDFKEPPERVPPVNRFRISVNSHTHVPDLVIAQIIFKDREVTEVDLPLLGPVSAETLINGGGAALKAILLIKALVEYLQKWNERHGFEKWWEDIKGNTINWGVDFAGLAGCIGKAIDFIKEQGENVRDRLENEAKQSAASAKKTVNDNLRRGGLPGIP